MKVYCGSCLCGQIQFQIEAKSPLPFGHCHCQACRKSHGADCTSATIVPAERLTLTQGEHLLASYRSSTKMERQFCSVCGARLFVRFSRATDDSEQAMCTVAINSLDDVDSWHESSHIYVGSKASWTELHDDLPKAKEAFLPR